MMKDSFLKYVGRLMERKEEVIYNIPNAMREDLKKR